MCSVNPHYMFDIIDSINAHILSEQDRSIRTSKNREF